MGQDMAVYEDTKFRCIETPICVLGLSAPFTSKRNLSYTAFEVRGCDSLHPGRHISTWAWHRPHRPAKQQQDTLGHLSCQSMPICGQWSWALHFQCLQRELGLLQATAHQLHLNTETRSCKNKFSTLTFQKQSLLKIPHTLSEGPIS